MDLQNVPDLILYKIFRYLPLDDLVRSRRLNKYFHRIATKVIGETKILDMSQPNFGGLMTKPDLFPGLIDLFSANLEKIIFSDDDVDSTIQEIFVHITCPRLVELKFPNLKLPPGLFCSILRNHPNLKSLIVKKTRNEIKIPAADVFDGDQLEILKLVNFSDDTFKRLIGRFPNLKQAILINCPDEVSFPQGELNDENVFEQFFQTHPKLEKFATDFSMYEIACANPSYFWKLGSLRSLKMGHPPLNDGFYNNVPRYFPNLTNLKIGYGDEKTAHFIAALGNLKNLTKLNLTIAYPKGIDTDGILRRVAMGCSKLRIVHLNICLVTSETMKAFVHLCPDLEYLDLLHVKDVLTTDQAIEVVRNIGVVSGNQQLKIAVYIRKKIWISKEVKDAAMEECPTIIFMKKGYYEFDDYWIRCSLKVMRNGDGPDDWDVMDDE